MPIVLGDILQELKVKRMSWSNQGKHVYADLHIDLRSYRGVHLFKYHGLDQSEAYSDLNTGLWANQSWVFRELFKWYHMDQSGENKSKRKIAAYEDIDNDIAKDINGAMEIIRETVDKVV